VILIAFQGAWNQRDIANPNTLALVTRPDTLAMTWIREHLPEPSNFLVESIIYRETEINGSDAGWSLPLLARRQNTLPPQYALNEAPIQPGYTQGMIDLVKKLETISLDSQQGVDLLCDEGITHVYIGQGQGKVALRAMNLGPQLFSPNDLLYSQNYGLLYHQDLVYVFALNPGVCP
jgi:hypothetical protein